MATTNAGNTDQSHMYTIGGKDKHWKATCRSPSISIEVESMTAIKLDFNLLIGMHFFVVVLHKLFLVNRSISLNSIYIEIYQDNPYILTANFTSQTTTMPLALHGLTIVLSIIQDCD